MTMADLDQVRVRTRVDETDIGKLAPGMEARISVASFPGKRFAGTIEKIEPQATVEQNVTLFPVLISLPNAEHLLRPGMNVEARFEVARRDDVLTVPITALRTERDVATTAGIIGVEAGCTARAARRGRRCRGGATRAPLRARERREPARQLLGRGAACGTREPVAVETGVTDLDRVEVIGGLAEGDVVLVLPSSSLLETQERLQNFMRGRGGIPGITQPAQQSRVAGRRPRVAAARPAAGRRGRPPRARRADVHGSHRMLEILRVAFTSIRGNLFRAALTMLGVIIGVAAVITMLALGTGAQRAVEEQLEALGANVVTVTTGMRFAQGIARDQQALTTDDAEALRARRAATLRRWRPSRVRRQQVKLGNRNLNLSVIGTTHDHAVVNGFELAGRTPAHRDRRLEPAPRRGAGRRGAGAAEGRPPAALLGQTILVKSLPFEVVGVYRKKGAIGFGNPDDDVYIPISTSQYRVVGNDRVQSIAVQVVPGVDLAQAMVEIERVVRREHGLAPGADNDFAVVDRKQFLATQQQTTQILGFLLAGIAGVSLVVGGIGIMNIMLVTVTERTREIGIRKALGATRFNILTQFLAESVVLCVLGGLLGMLLGIGAARALARLAGWQTYVTPDALLLAFAFSAGVGCCSACGPRAARRRWTRSRRCATSDSTGAGLHGLLRRVECADEFARPNAMPFAGEVVRDAGVDLPADQRVVEQ